MNIFKDPSLCHIGITTGTSFMINSYTSNLSGIETGDSSVVCWELTEAL